MPRSMSTEEKYKLIEDIQRYEYIWNKKHASYFDSPLKLRAFEEIGQGFEPKYSGAEIKAFWNTLRNSFTRELDQRPSGSEAVKAPKWEFFNALMFLKENVKKRSTTSNVASLVQAPESGEEQAATSPATDGNRDLENDVVSLVPESGQDKTTPKLPSGSKRKRTADLDEIDEYLLKQLKESSEERDPDMLFGASVGATLKKMTEATKIRAKMQIQNVLGQAELADLDARASMSSPPVILQPASNAYEYGTASTSTTVLSVNGSNLTSL